jgi:hypothetical protein
MSLAENVQKKLEAYRADGSHCHASGLHRQKRTSLAIITRDGRRWNMPWAHLFFSYFDAQPGAESIHLSYRTHEVTVEGEHLQELAAEIERSEVEWMQACKEASDQARDSDRPIITKITVSEKGKL